MGLCSFFDNTMKNIVQNGPYIEEAQTVCLGFEPRTAEW